MAVPISERLLSLLFPARCVMCQELTGPADLFCGSCSWQEAGPRTAVDTLPGSACCHVLALYHYDDTTAKAMLARKEFRERRMADFFARELSSAVAARMKASLPQLVTCVPMSLSTRRKRGFNHAEDLARDVAKLLSLPYRDGLLLRDDDSRIQRHLTREERLANAALSYHPGKNAEHAADKHILLVDDVLTTGATAKACVGCLRASGAAAVSVSVLCVAEPGREQPADDVT